MKTITKKQIVAATGIDQTPEQILEEHDRRVASWWWRHLQWRAKNTQRPITKTGEEEETPCVLRYITHLVPYYALAQIAICATVLFGKISTIEALTDLFWSIGIALYGYHYTLVRTATKAPYHHPSIAIATLVIGAIVFGAGMLISVLCATFLNILFGYQLTLKIIVPLSGLITTLFGGITIDVHDSGADPKETFVRTVKRAYPFYVNAALALFCAPLYLPLYLLDRWILPHKSQQVYAIDKRTTAESRAELVRETYTRGLASVRQELLGPKSDLQQNRTIYTERLATIRERKQRAETRLSRVKPAQKDRWENLTEFITTLVAREQQFITEAERLEKDLIPRVGALLAEVEAEIQGLDVYLVDEALFAEEVADAEQDAQLILQARNSTEKAIHRLGNRLYDLQIAVQNAAISRELTDSDKALEEAFRRQGQFAEKLAELETAAEPPEEPLLAEGHAVH